VITLPTKRQPIPSRASRWGGVLAVLVVAWLAAGCSGLPRSATPPSESALQATLETAPPAGPQPASTKVEAGGPPPTTLRFENISVEQGLSEGTVYCTFQDSKGFLWFCTQDGLNKFDGYSFKVYRPDPTRNSIAVGFVRSICEGPSGELWIGTMGGGLNRFDPDTERFTHYRYDPRDPSSLKGDWVSTVYLDPQGGLWAGTTTGLNRFDLETEEITRYEHYEEYPASLGHPTVNAVFRDREGVLWVGTGGGLDRGDPVRQRFIHYRHDPDDPNSLGGDSVQAIYQDSQGILWIGTDGGLDRLDRQAGQFIHYRHDPDDPTSLSNDSVQSIYQDREGTLWIGTTDGLNWFDRERERFVRYQSDPGDPNSLSSDWIWSIYQDREGVLWIGTYRGGLSKYDRLSDRFALYRAIPGDPNSLNNNQIWSIYQDRDGILWIGTGGGGLNRFDREQGLMSQYRHDPADANSLSHDVVRAILQDSEGMLWIGTDGGGLDRFDPEREQFVHFQNDPADRYSLSHDAVRVIYEDRQNQLWIGTDGGGLNRLDRATGRFDRFPADPDDPNGLPGPSIWAVTEDRQGMLWVGTAGSGLQRFDRVTQQFTWYRHERSDIILSIHDDRWGNLWVATYGNGLYHFDRVTGTFTPYQVEDGLPSNAVYGILEDEQGYLWLSTNNGLSQFDPPTKTFKNFDVSDGLQSKEFNGGSYSRSSSGEMFFGGINGFNAFYPESLREDNPYAPPVVLTSLTQGGEPIVTDRAVDSVSEFWLDWPDNYFEFEFAALSYSRPEKNQYAHMLEGFDKEWIQVGTRRFGRYTNLPGGTYTLRVIGSNGEGVWNQEGVAVSVRVVPPFWQTWTFRVIVLAVLAAGAVGVYRQRVTGIEKRSRELEREVSERTHEIEQRRRVAEGLRDILAVLNSDRPLDEVLDYIVAQAGQLLGAGATVLHQIEPERDYVTIQASHGLPDELAGVQAIPFAASGADEAILTRRPYLLPDLAGTAADAGRADDPAATLWQEVMRRYYRSFLAVPLTVEGRADHCLAFYYTDPQAISDEDLGLATALADQATLAIENARLYGQAQELAAVEERQRLARDLHDAVSQTLFSASLIAEALPDIWGASPEQGQQLLDKLRQLSRGALAEMRTLLMELRPAALAEASLTDLLRQLGQAVTGREGIPVSVSADDLRELPAEVHLAFYRIAQEALNNVVKHAQASQVEVTLRGVPPEDGEGDAKGIEMGIHDDGCGFDPAGVAADRLGLGIMRERAAAIRARLEIESEPGNGTRVTLVWPAKGELE
jgi:signal transduction histidine kinase/ligand-binding sensor domain-containing protein